MINTIDEMVKRLRKFNSNTNVIKKDNASWDTSYVNCPGFKNINHIPPFYAFEWTYVNEIIPNIDNINEIYTSLKFNQAKLGKFYNLTFTDKYHRYIKNDPFNYLQSYRLEINDDNDTLKNVELVVIINYEIFKIRFGRKGTAASDMNGMEAYKLFRDSCEKHGIDLKKYKAKKQERESIKNSIPLLDRIRNEKLPYKWYDHVNHLDFHSAWPAGVIKSYPKFKPVFEELYSIHKQTGPKALGFCQSAFIHYCYVNLASIGITWCHNKLWELVEKLEANGYIICVLNTDGIWYMSADGTQRVYHDEDEGIDFGQYRNDHIDCRAYFESSSQYCFYENDNFNVVASGNYIYEKIKDRSKWNESDFFKAINEPNIMLDWNDSIGFTYTNMEDTYGE